MIKIAIITSLFGEIDILHTPRWYFKNADYYAFVDRNWNVEKWKQIQASDFSIDDKYRMRRNAKIYKILPELFLPDYDYYFYVDPSHCVMENPETIIDNYMLEKDIAVFKHNQRDCIYDECGKLTEWKYDTSENLNKWVSYCKENKYPEHNGLYELPAFLKKKTNKITEACLMWYEVICRYSSRDQVSLPYVLWKKGIEPAILTGFANGRNIDGSLGMNKIAPQIWEKKR